MTMRALIAVLTLCVSTAWAATTVPAVTGVGTDLTNGVTTGVLGAANGGTGIANNAAATLTRSGSHALTITTTNTTNVTLPTSGTLATTAGNVATATALAANPTDCASNQYANAIDASGNLTCAQPSTFGDITATTVSVGTSPAQAGHVRIPNAGTITARNSTNAKNMEVAKINAQDVFIFGDGYGETVANDGVISLGSLQTGLLVLVSNTDFTCVFVISNLIPYELSDPDNKCSVAQGTGSMFNVYNNAGVVNLENKSGGSRSFNLSLVK